MPTKERTGIERVVDETAVTLLGAASQIVYRHLNKIRKYAEISLRALGIEPMELNLF